MWKADTAMMAQTRNEMMIDDPKRDESIVPIYVVNEGVERSRHGS